MTSLEPTKKRIRESAYPVYWVEVFNAALQKWISVDPLVTKTLAKPSKLEPPSNDPGNMLSYVIAFEEDGSARDVTRRYAKAYNAKTRKLRVESTKGGQKWWKRVMKLYRRTYSLDRDQVEDAELTSREASEPMPNNIADFKGHPYYALERHLRRNEVIHPRHETGKASVGRSASGDPVLEPIFRRSDVHVVKSEDGWYRLGRVLKEDEEPLKLARPRGKKDPLFDEDAEEDAEEDPGVLLYAGFQTCAYEAPPVVNGRIPKNVYKNLDVYVPSMIPPGGVHISHPGTARAARILGIDYADAVTGFEFKGRTGTAVVKGAVVAGEFHDAVVEVIRGFEYERDEVELEKRRLLALRMWKRFLAGLRIKQRIEGYEIEGERDAVRQESKDNEEDDEEVDGDDEDYDDAEVEGDFEREAEEVSQPMEEPAKPAMHEHQPIISTWGKPLPKPSHQQKPDSPSRESEAYPTENFSPHLFEAEGGGFFTEDTDHATPKIHDDFDESEQSRAESQPKAAARSSMNRSARTPSLEDDPQAHGISAAELKEARLAQELHEVRDQERGSKGVIGSGPAQGMQEARVAAEMSAVDWDGKGGGRDESEKSRMSRPESPEEEDGRDESDKGSLLSHDPEDEDADPEWIL